MIKIAILNDNRCSNDEFAHIHGFSAWIDKDGYKFLFDAGQEDCFIKNAKKLGINLNETQCVVLSHGDYDHGNGLKFLNLPHKVPLICHPDFDKYRLSKRTGKFDGLNQTRDELSKQFELKLHKDCFEISKNIYFLGQIERKSDYEVGNLPMLDETGKVYPHLDDSGVVIKTKQGLVIITGCAHSGICNIIEYSKTIFEDDKIYAAIGGFHLNKVDEQTIKTAEYFLNNDIKKLYLGHCTSDEACDYLKEKLKNKIDVEIISSGFQIELED